MTYDVILTIDLRIKSYTRYIKPEDYTKYYIVHLACMPQYFQTPLGNEMFRNAEILLYYLMLSQPTSILYCVLGRRPL